MAEPVPVEYLSRAAAGTRAILAKVQPEQFTEPTPCAGWDVQALIDHFVAVPRGIATRLNGGELVTNGGTAGGDLLANYDESVRTAVAAFSDPAALATQITMPFGEVNGAFMLGMVCADQFVHGWDLARATGQTDAAFDEDLAAELLPRVRASITPAFRGEEGQAPFGPAVEAPAGASATEQLVAFYGRSLAH